MNEHDFEDELPEDFEFAAEPDIDEVVMPADSRIAHWRRIELMQERLQLLKQINDFDDDLD